MGSVGFLRRAWSSTKRVPVSGRVVTPFPCGETWEEGRARRVLGLLGLLQHQAPQAARASPSAHPCRRLGEAVVNLSINCAGREGGSSREIQPIDMPTGRVSIACTPGLCSGSTDPAAALPEPPGLSLRCLVVLRFPPPRRGAGKGKGGIPAYSRHRQSLGQDLAWLHLPHWEILGQNRSCFNFPVSARAAQHGRGPHATSIAFLSCGGTGTAATASTQGPAGSPPAEGTLPR